MSWLSSKPQYQCRGFQLRGIAAKSSQLDAAESETRLFLSCTVRGRDCP